MINSQRFRVIMCNINIVTRWSPLLQSRVFNTSCSLFTHVLDTLNPVLYTFSLQNSTRIRDTCITISVNILLNKKFQTFGRKFYKNTWKLSLSSKSLLIFIHKTPAVKKHAITREIRDLLQWRSTTTGNTVYFCISSSLIYTLEIHTQSFKHSVRWRH